MARWCLTADLQWDAYENFSTLTPLGVTTRLTDMVKCWRWITDTALKQKCEGIIAVGDIFDSRTVIDLSVLDQACRAVHASVRAGLRVIFVPGNHDSYLKSPVINSLQVFLGHCEVIEEPTMVKGLGFLPWMDDAKAFKQGVADLAGKGAEYLFAHVLVEGAVHKDAGGIPVKWLQPEKFKRVMLGDVHEPYEITEKVCYVGSPMQLDYGDAGGKRGIRILDTATNKLTYVENTVSPRFHIVTGEQKAEIHDGDFVRIKTDDPMIAAHALAAAKAKTKWVETTFVEVGDSKPRIDVRSSHAHEEVLKKYAAFKGRTDDYTLQVGVDILERARG